MGKGASEERTRQIGRATDRADPTTLAEVTVSISQQLIKRMDNHQLEVGECGIEEEGCYEVSEFMGQTKHGSAN